MGKNESKYKRIFEDNSLSEHQKYSKINRLLKKNIHSDKGSKFWIVVIVLNIITLPLLFYSNIDTDNPKLSQVAILINQRK